MGYILPAKFAASLPAQHCLILRVRRRMEMHDDAVAAFLEPLVGPKAEAWLLRAFHSW